MSKICSLRLCVLFLLLPVLFYSCATPSHLRARAEPSVYIEEKGTVDAERLYAFFVAQLPRSAQGYEERIGRARRLASFYVEEARIEGINSDVAYVQMCLETGYLGFGGLVTADMNNFCGLGSLGPQQPGLRFPDECSGVRAHIQHLKAYGSQQPLKNTCVDPRFKYVTPRGKAPTVYELSGTWASDRAYGEKLAALLLRLSEF